MKGSDDNSKIKNLVQNNYWDVINLYYLAFECDIQTQYIF